MTQARRRGNQRQEQEQAEQNISEGEQTSMTTSNEMSTQPDYDAFMKWRESQVSKKAGGKARRSALQALKKNHEGEYNQLVEQFKAQGED